MLNGTRMRVIGIHDELRRIAATAERGAAHAIPFAYAEAGHLSHAYAMTIHKAQGATVEQAFVLAQPGLSAQQAYTALSRATDRTDIYIDESPRLDPEAHAPARTNRSAVERIATTLRRSVREELAIDQGPLDRLPVQALRAERDRLQPQLDGRPPDHRARLADLQDEIRKTRVSYEQALQRRDRAAEDLDHLGPIGRRVHRNQRLELEHRQDVATRDVDSYGEQLRALTVEHRQRSREQRSYQRWEAVHAPELDRVNELTQAIRIARSLERGPTPTTDRSIGRGLSLGR
jgi:hypothetical protein